MLKKGLTLALATVLAILTLPGINGKAFASLPSEFEKTVAVTGLTDPTAFRFAPNGDMYIAEQSGAIKVFRAPSTIITVGTLPVVNDHEKGLLGLELDKNFATNHYLYASYTHTDGFTRLSRFTVNNDVLDMASEFLFYKSNQAASIYHNANDIHYGPDGKIWWSVGDNLVTGNSQSLTSIHGKIARFDPDGTSANDNPWHGQHDKVDQIYALGFRNPFRFTFLPTGKAIVGDVGGAAWEELDIVQPGANYGWPQYEGNCGACGYANPVFAYPHNGLNSAISAMTVYDGAAFSPQYDGVLFYGDYARQTIRYLKFDSTYTSVISDNAFDDAAGTVVDMHVGPDGGLYYASIFNGNIFKIAPAGGNRVPIAKAAADTIAGLAPLAVNFSSAGSVDPDGTALTYLWDFGDGTTSTDPNPSHTYTANGTYSVTLTVSDGQKTATTSVTVTVGNRLPTVSIDTPVIGTKYNAGDIISYSGSATDPEDGILPPSAFSWTIHFQHADHVHPFLGPIDGSSSGSFSIGRDATNEYNTWYRIELTVTDSGGLKSTTYRDVNPNLVNLTIQTNTNGGKFNVDGNLYAAAYTHQEVVGVDHGITVPSPQINGADKYRFRGWSDGGDQTHTYRVPPTDSTLTASLYQALPPPSPWQTTDIGNPALPGNADYDATNQAFTVDGGGKDIWGTRDELRYMYQPLSGDGEIVSRVTSQTATDPWSKSGIMIKESATPGATYALIGVSPGNGLFMQYNFNKNAGPRPVFAFPAWLKMKRVGNVFTGYYSSDGAAWTQLGSATVPMAANATVGTFVSGHSTAAVCTTVFDHVSVSNPAPPPPALPAPWLDADVGVAKPAPGSGIYSYATGMFTLKGGGYDIWSSHDDFHYVYQTLNGDGQIIARVTSQGNTNASAKAGVMIKESTAAFAPYSFMGITPANGYKFQWTFQPQSIAGGAYTAPDAWVKLTRVGDVMTAYKSPDGITWTKVGQKTVVMSPTATIGLFDTSHNSGALSAVTFDNVSVTP
jgi:glucose/arabinose dehydrogenase/regulation of enolase protein 1 (concanavalin A-like superfamily)